MRKKMLIILAAFGAAVALLVPSPVMSASDTTCTTTITGTHDNVVVPPGQTCIVNGATVLGNVTAFQDSRLHVTNSNVRGNVLGDKADVVQVSNSTVRENVIIKEGGPGAVAAGFFGCGSGICEAVVISTNVQEGSIQIEKMQGGVFVQSNFLFSPIRGNIKVEENLANSPDFLSVNNSRVAQNLQVFKNKGTGSKFVNSNTVGENLQCFENDLPFFGAGNTEQQAQGQCS